MDQSRPLFVYFSSILVTISISIEKSMDGVPWDSNPGPQAGRLRQNHGAMAATSKYNNVIFWFPFSLYLHSTKFWSLSVIRFVFNKVKKFLWGVFIAQLVELCLLTAEICGLNPVIGNSFFTVNWIQKGKVKNKRPGMTQFKIKVRAILSKKFIYFSSFWNVLKSFISKIFTTNVEREKIPNLEHCCLLVVSIYL